MSILRSFTQKGQGKMTDNYGNVIFAICLCLILLSTTAVRAWASPSESQLGSIESQAQTDYENGKYLSAISLLKRALLSDPKDARLIIDLASAEAELSNFTGALSLYEQVLNISSHDISAFVGIGLSLKHLGNSSTATKYFKEAVAQPIITNDSKAEELEKAMAFTYIGNYTQAVNIANQVLRQNPTDFGALEIKAMSLIYMNKAADALTVLNNLVSEGHGVPWVLDDRGITLMMLKNYVGAIANFNATLKAEPADAFAYFNRAEAILNLDFYQQNNQHNKQLIFPHLDIALQDLNKVIQINPYDTDARDLKSLLIHGLKLGFVKR
jgi:tetratricopeptide (TPR) repeat protein